jgi:hypothetical protein
MKYHSMLGTLILFLIGAFTHLDSHLTASCFELIGLKTKLDGFISLTRGLSGRKLLVADQSALILGLNDLH